MNNFNGPYLAKSVQEFWSRWHISLSTWFKDYLYIPLGGNRVGIPRWYLNTFIVFLVSGLWHGASWNFVIWGALHGFYIVFANLTAKPREAINKVFLVNKIPILKTFTTFVLVAFAWIFFRATDFKTASYIITHLDDGFKEIITNMLQGKPAFEYLGISKMFALGLIIFLETVHYIKSKHNISDWFTKQPIAIRWGVYFILVMMIMAYGVFEDRQFIYFQF
jgi:D-alanyl-lipoteichoic acid acyltransferase DltB (MBOAT superfamily)